MKDKYADLPIDIKQAHFDKLNGYRNSLRKEPELRALFIEMTLNCNEHCRHCGSNCGDVKQEGQLTDYEILQNLVQLKNRLEKENKKLPFLNITGGEPLLRPGMIDLMKTIHMLGYKWGMTSNGVLITREVAKQLKDAGMYSIGLSLDGLRESHDWFRRREGSFDLTCNVIQYLLEAGIESVMVTTVVHKKNIAELEEIYKVMKTTGCHTWRVINVDPIGRAIDNEEILLNKEELKYMMDFIVSHQSEDPDSLEIIYSCNHYLGLEYERKVRSWYFFCRAGIHVASIQYNGDISACLDIERRPELTFGNVRKDDFYDVWLHEFAPFRVDKTKDSKTCKDCTDRGNCQGSGFHTWDYDNKEPRICMKEVLEG